MRLASVILLATTTLTLFTACGGGDEESAPSETTTTATLTNATDTTDTLGESSPETETTIAEPTEAPGEFIETLLDYGLKGQHGRAWDVLHPTHQKVATRERFEECRSEELEALAGVDVESFDVVEVYDDPINIAGVPEKTSKAVTYRIVVSDADETETFTDTGHAVQIGDHWVWLLEPGDVRDYKAGNCPT